MALNILSTREQNTLALLQSRPQGIDEYDLIKALQADPSNELPSGSLIEPLILFRCHFLVYNTLYKLRDYLSHSQQAHLEIGPLKSRLHPYRSASTAISDYDSLHKFYLDESHLHSTKEADVVDLLAQFWVKFHAAEQRHKALQTLALSEPVDYAKIKQQYRRLAMLYHPDRGGDQEQLQAINWALEVLENYYR